MTVPAASGQIDLFSAPQPDGSKRVAPTAPATGSPFGSLATSKSKYHTVKDEAGIKKLVSLLEGHENITFDTETTGIDAISAELVGLAFAVEEGEAFYVPIPAEREAAQAIVEFFRKVLEDPAVAKTGHQRLKKNRTEFP